MFRKFGNVPETSTRMFRKFEKFDSRMFRKIDGLFRDVREARADFQHLSCMHRIGLTTQTNLTVPDHSNVY